MSTTTSSSSSGTVATAGVGLPPTVYVILSRDDSGFWTEHGETVAAASAEAAIRKVHGGSPKGGTYVAVPARSWKPVKVTTETKTVVKIGDAA